MRFAAQRGCGQGARQLPKQERRRPGGGGRRRLVLRRTPGRRRGPAASSEARSPGTNGVPGRRRGTSVRLNDRSPGRRRGNRPQLGRSLAAPELGGGDAREEETRHRRKQKTQGGGEGLLYSAFLAPGGLCRQSADHAACDAQIIQIALGEPSQLAQRGTIDAPPPQFFSHCRQQCRYAPSCPERRSSVCQQGHRKFPGCVRAPCPLAADR